MTVYSSDKVNVSSSSDIQSISSIVVINPTFYDEPSVLIEISLSAWVVLYSSVARRRNSIIFNHENFMTRCAKLS